MPTTGIEPTTPVNLWGTEYYAQEAEIRRNRKWNLLLQPAVLASYLAIGGRAVFGPLAIFVLFTFTSYLSDGTVFIKADSSFFAFTEADMSLAGGCTACLGPCKIGLLKYSMFNGSALTIAPTFNAFSALAQRESLYDFSALSKEALALAENLDSNGAVCQSGLSDWGSTYSAVKGTPYQIMNIITTLKLSVAPQMVRELEEAITNGEECLSTWNMIAIGRLFMYPTKAGDSNFGKVAAVDINVFPDFTECRAQVKADFGAIGSKLAMATNGENILSVVPDVLTLFPYIFTSSIPRVSRVVPAGNTHFGAKSVVQPQLRGYYGGCRVREVNTTGIYIEATCSVSKHWEMYGLMIHSPDDIPLCSTGDVCIRNYYNSNWEWVNGFAPDIPGRTLITANTFRNRYADKVELNVLPGLAVVQILSMGIVSLYQVMSHKRSVLLTQIWAYRCQMGRMQVLYLGQVIYHLVNNSDLYWLGLATGTLTTESIANLTCCFFVFSYSFVNLVNARSGDQKLSRHFRLTWETMQLITTIFVWTMLRSVQQKSLLYIITENSEILRKNSVRGATFCGLNDACILFRVSVPTVVTMLSVTLGSLATILTFIVKKLSAKAISSDRTAQRSLTRLLTIRIMNPTQVTAFIPESVEGFERRYNETLLDTLTSFERHCIGGPFRKLFHDCDDIAYVMYHGRRCTTVEALLMTGHLYYGDHIYEATSVVLLLISRILPHRFLRTFNLLLLRWYVNPRQGTLSHALSCTWYVASEERHELPGAVPIA
ncbi:hypothetical protein PHMEG_0002557 [Phytophthora megakarya]|uniref:Transmembrane protein n=1 Tax=Phytophthora megakarya TaxID=4795 RepID=A0A225WYS5_9STRA|nr:hypothetical protein PHMEG_0002557 [Phytophthora megakarya]